jgi:hypothetical protein
MAHQQHAPDRVQVEEAPALVPDCPHCGAALDTIRARMLPTTGSTKS